MAKEKELKNNSTAPGMATGLNPTEANRQNKQELRRRLQGVAVFMASKNGRLNKDGIAEYMDVLKNNIERNPAYSVRQKEMKRLCWDVVIGRAPDFFNLEEIQEAVNYLFNDLEEIR